MKLIVGLGNIGPKYHFTRHNIGFLIIEQFAASYKNVTFQHYEKYKAEMAKIHIDNHDILLLKPSTYMNLSGTSVSAVKNYFKINISDILIVHDDIDLLSHQIKVKIAGGNAGHNGLRSITQHCSNNYKRLRYGVGRPLPDSHVDIADYVLQNLDQEFLSTLKDRAQMINDIIYQNINS